MGNKKIMWYQEEREQNKVVVSSRVRQALNLQNEHFPHLLQARDATLLASQIKEAIRQVLPTEKLVEMKLRELSQLESWYLVEHYLISKELLDHQEIAELIFTENEEVSVMLFEEDHLRLQSFASGFDLNRPFQRLEQITAGLEQKLKIAKDDELGYLTTCPSNLGTGMRASVMLYLPALEKYRQLAAIAKQISRHGFTLRGSFGESTEANFSLWQLSNQRSIGQTKSQIISSLQALVKELCQREMEIRQSWYQEHPLYVEDLVYRALAVLKSARVLGLDEARKAVSHLRLARSLDLMPKLSYATINNLAMNLGQNTVRRLEANEDLEVARAKIARKILAEVKI